ncbi:MAG: ParB/RepB/Spo0J family partition protein [Acidobacteriia bacterium]|nr:ParB/RepB/Spo0J family partition protein [Terriglobia bacterium]
MPQLNRIETELIDANPGNPRLLFPEEEMEQLAESIANEGVLVPIVVYNQGDRFVLIDGERRWRCARQLGLEEVPAVIVDAPDERRTLIQMFNIHMVRQSWADMPTAWALKKLMEETGIERPQELSDLTGLSPERLKRLRHALELPDQYQKYIHDGDIPLNFFWELKRNVIDPLAKQRPRLAAEFGENEVLDAFVQKRLHEITTDTVSLRNVRPIINLAAEDAGEVDADSVLDVAIRDLIKNPDATIQDAYEDTVMVIVEADKLQRRSDNMLKAFERLLDKARSDEERTHVRNVGTGLINKLMALIAGQVQ